MLGFTTDGNYNNETTYDNNEDNNTPTATTATTTGNKIKIMLFETFTIKFHV